MLDPRTAEVTEVTWQRSVASSRSEWWLGLGQQESTDMSEPTVLWVAVMRPDGVRRPTERGPSEPPLRVGKVKVALTEVLRSQRE